MGNGEPYSLAFSPAAQRDFKKLPAQYADRIRQAIAALSTDPRPRGFRKIVDDPALRKRVGDFRVIYDVDDSGRTVQIQRILRRSERIYRR